LQVAPSAYRRHAALLREPHKRCARAHRDEMLMPQIECVWQANMQVYGADKVWRTGSPLRAIRPASARFQQALVLRPPQGAGHAARVPAVDAQGADHRCRRCGIRVLIGILRIGGCAAVLAGCPPE